MSCYKPMLAYKTGAVNVETGKQQYRFLGSVERFSLDHPEIDVDQQVRETGYVWVPSYKYAPDAMPTVPYANADGEFLGWKFSSPLKVLPCGQCLGCRVAYAASWANRIMLEARDYEKVYFLTLTYDNEHVPVHVSNVGEDVLSLEPKDLRDFLKRLRWQQAYYHSNTIRFYGVGEYGELYHRPHYHLIVYGLMIDDIRDAYKNKHGRMIHTSDTIRDVWGKGIVEVEELSWELAAYAARYTVKKLGKKESDFYETFNIEPEFSRMSNRPAIGYKYLQENMKEIYKNDEIIIKLATGSRKVKPPRYYDQKYDDVYPEQMAEIKGNRQEIATEHLKLKLDRFSGSYLELLHNEEEAFKSRTKSLRRELEL